MSLSRISALALAFALFGCGDDDTVSDGSTPTDGSSSARCPSGAPNPTQLSGPCCSRSSNADKQDAPEYRLAAIELTNPPTLSTPVVAGLLKSAVDEERFNWLIRLGSLDGEATILTGYGKRNDDNTFRFADGEAPTPGDANRWNPLMTDLNVDGEVVSTGALDGTFTLPVFTVENDLQLELPLNALELEMATLSEERDCIGGRTGSQWTTAGDVTTYITVADAEAGNLVVGTTLMTTLCMFTAGLQVEPGNCSDYDRITTTACEMASECQTANGGPGGGCVTTDDGKFCGWPAPPDSRCDGATCVQGECDPYDAQGGCNAWQLKGSFAAQAVEITD